MTKKELEDIFLGRPIEHELVCVDNIHVEDELTKGKIYSTISSLDSKKFVIYCDDGDRGEYFAWRFAKVSYRS